jgi:beta-fructofuranosidase
MNVAEIVADDPHAPRWHFLAPERTAVPFDPNGAIWWKGRYHLFYIFQDPALPHGGHCWGHASSTDLLHWTYHPTALAPAPGDPDKGIFSGGAFVDKEGVPTIIYHGVGAGTCLARATDDDLIVWQKHPGNPVIPEPASGEPGDGVYNVFDPHCWLEGDTYYAILGGKVKPWNLRDTAYLFSSKDLATWDYLRPFYAPHPHWTGEDEDCACPDFFPLGDRHCLLCISHPRGARYYLGRWQDQTFVPEEHGRMNWPGGGCFAPESLLDGDGRRVMWAWAIEQRRWMLDGKRALGVMTMPRVLHLGADGGLRVSPPVELESLRGTGWSGTMRLEGSPQALPIQSDSLELNIEVPASELGAIHVAVRRTPADEQHTDIIVDFAAGELHIDTSHSGAGEHAWRPFPLISGDAAQDHPVQTAPFVVPHGEPLRLRVFVDRSMVEVFANDRLCMTGRCYPSRADATGVALSSRGDAAVARLEAWPLARSLSK